MPSYKRPGVYAEEVLNPSAVVTTPSSGIGVFIAANPRGPVVPTLIESWSQYLRLFGGFEGATDYLPYALHQFFSNGGRVAWVTRVAGSGAAAATRTLNDGAGAPLATLQVDASNPGAWGQDVYIEVAHNGTDRFDLIVRHGGAGDAYIVERWAELSMDVNDSRYVENVVNTAYGGSAFVAVTDLASATVAPDNRPAITAATALTGGTDPAVTTTDLTDAQNLHDTVIGPLTINMPGVSDGAVLAALLTYCSNRGDSFAVLDVAADQTPADVVATAGSYNSAYGALYYPWIRIVDPGSSSQGALKSIPPGGAVVGQYARTDLLRGVHKAPAGIDNRIAGAVTVEQKLTNTDLDNLNSAQVNAIRHMPGVGVAIMGARTLRPVAADRYISTRRTLNYIRWALVDGTQWAVFEPNDQVLWSGLSTNIMQFLLQMWQQGALRGSSAEEAFYVKCDSENNSEQSIANGQVNIEVGVALQYPAEFIVIRIGQWQGGSTAIVTV